MAVLLSVFKPSSRVEISACCDPDGNFRLPGVCREVGHRGYNGRGCALVGEETSLCRC